jgi:hypothetical protein
MDRPQDGPAAPAVPRFPGARSRPSARASVPLRLFMLALLLVAILYGSDIAVTSSLVSLAGPAGRALAAAPPARLWAYVPVPAPGARGATLDAGEGEPVLSAYEAAPPASSDLSRRVAEIRRTLGTVVEGVAWQGTIAAPVRALLSLVDGELQWSGSGAGTVFWPSGRLRLTPGTCVAERSFSPLTLPLAPFVRNDELYLPVSSAAAAWGLQRSVDAASGVQTLVLGRRSLSILPGARAFHIEIDRSDRWVRVYYAGALAKQYPACTGEGDNTPVGEFHIQNKACWAGWRAYWGEYMPGGSPRNPLGARWLGTTARGRATSRVIGIHGTNQPSSIGTRVSGGCVRLHNQDVIELYDVIPVGTAVSIHE